MKYCPQCNAQLADEAVFCNRCGAPMNSAPQPQPEPAPFVPEMDSVVPPVIDDNTFAQPQQPQQPVQQPFAQPQQPQPFPGFAQPQGIPQPQPFQSFDQAPFEQPQAQSPDYINPAAPQMPGVTPGKSGSSLVVPIILIILILAVICIDVFWLFRDQIFGKKDDSSTAAASYITMVDEQTDLSI